MMNTKKHDLHLFCMSLNSVAMPSKLLLIRGLFKKYPTFFPLANKV